MSSLREDEISQRIFYAGMFGLPWLWIVHSSGYYSNKRSDNALLNNEDTDASSAENQEMWIRRCRGSAIFVTILWLAWIIVVQFAMPDAFPEALFVRVPDQGEYTGW